jgi:hypothetical protein
MSDPSTASLPFSTAGGPATSARLTVAVGEDREPALALAHFDRADPAGVDASNTTGGLVRRFRETGGKAVRVGPGLLRIVVRFPMDGGFVPDAARILNRAVRPLLRALRSLLPLTHYFGRDVVTSKVGAVRHAIAAVAFAHDGASGQGTFEAVLSTRPGLAPRADLSALADVLPERPDGWETKISDAISQSYEREGAIRVPLEPLSAQGADGPTTPWDHLEHAEPVGMRVGASVAPLAVGGDFFVSTDWLIGIRAALAALPRPTTEAAVRAVLEEDPPEANGDVLLGIEGPHVLSQALLTALAHAGEFRDQTTL